MSREWTPNAGGTNNTTLRRGTDNTPLYSEWANDPSDYPTSARDLHTSTQYKVFGQVDILSDDHIELLKKFMRREVTADIKPPLIVTGDSLFVATNKFGKPVTMLFDDDWEYKLAARWITDEQVYIALFNYMDEFYLDLGEMLKQLSQSLIVTLCNTCHVTSLKSTGDITSIDSTLDGKIQKRVIELDGIREIIRTLVQLPLYKQSINQIIKDDNPYDMYGRTLPEDVKRAIESRFIDTTLKSVIGDRKKLISYIEKMDSYIIALKTAAGVQDK